MYQRHVVSVWQETFCKHAAAAQGKSNTDPQKVCMGKAIQYQIKQWLK